MYRLVAENVTRFACDGVVFNGSRVQELKVYLGNSSHLPVHKCTLQLQNGRLPDLLMAPIDFGFYDIITLSLATLGLLVLCCFLMDTIWTFLQLIRSLLAPYLLTNEEHTTVKKYGEWALITGCTDGIGKEYAFEMAKRGHSIILVSRSKDKLEATAKEIENLHAVKTKIIVADFSQGQLAINHIRGELGAIPVAVLVNNVGSQYAYPMYVGEVPEEQLWNIININIGAVTMMTRMLIGDMKLRGRGAVVNVSSGSEMQPLPLMTVYAASKMYIKSFTEALRYEYASSNVTVQHLAPFFVNTKMNNFSNRLRRTSVFVPDARSFAKYAVGTLGKVDHSTGYWSHGVQHFFFSIAPVWLRMHIGGFLNKSFRREYFKINNIK